MNARERGFLLLTSHLGDPERKTLTVPQLRVLAERMQTMEISAEDRDLSATDLMDIGYSREMSQRIVALLSQEEELDYYLNRGKKAGCFPVTRVNPKYPLLLRQRLGLDSPGCLWIKGDISILDAPAISLVGSRDLLPRNAAFAESVGRHSANQGLTLVSGNARGADRTAQGAALTAGGTVISIVADELSKQVIRERILYVSEEDFDAPFSAQRALRRNRCIHALGRMVFVAQSDYGKGGTWDGTVKNLRYNWSPVACFRDGSEASRQMEQMGAFLVTESDLTDLSGLLSTELRLF